MNPIETLTDEALLLKLRGTEHDFVERKPRGQKGDWLQAAVAFANSAPIGWPAVLFVGVDDDGTPQQGPEKLEDLSKSIAGTLEQAYPPIYFDIRPLHIGDRACLAVVIPGSENRPHFAGKSYVRLGPSTQEASESQFSELIASRNSKARAIQEWIGKDISWMLRSGALGDTFPSGRITVAGCNSHYATFEMWEGQTIANVQSEPLTRIELGFDHKRQRLQVILYSIR
jgi:Putative DNA-binding domain